ncbi:Transcription factor [Globisporangium polare]
MAMQANASSLPAAAAAAAAAPLGAARPVRPQVLGAQCLDHIALEGRAGVAMAALFAHVDPWNDADMRRQVWQLLQRQHARGVLQFYYRSVSAAAETSSSSSSSSGGGGDVSVGWHSVSGYQKEQRSNSPALIGKKRKRPTSVGSDQATESHTPSKAMASPQRSPGVRASASHDPGCNSVEQRTAVERISADEATAIEDNSLQLQINPGEAIPNNAHANDRTASDAHPANDDGDGTVSEPEDVSYLTVDDIDALSLEDALLTPPVISNAGQQNTMELVVVACAELRHRVLNISVKAVLAELVDEHFTILEAVGRARVQGITVAGLGAFFPAGTVKRLHNALDTLISYSLVLKRMMIVAKPTMRRLNIIHLPRFASDFVPHMFDESAEFESDEAYKKILSATAEAYLLKIPGQSCVLTDMGRDLNLHKRHLEILRGHVMHEAKKDERYHLELFQAVLRPTKKNTIEPKILNCIRYKPSSSTGNQLSSSSASGGSRRGIVMEMGLLHQIYSLIEESGDHGSTISEMRNQIVLPGSKLPYKLVSILAGTYGLKAETIILGKNKAFRLYVNSAQTTALLSNPASQPMLLLENGTVEGSSKRQGDVFSIRANLALKDALGPGHEVDGTRSRRRSHILQRLVLEKIISLSSLRASVFGMEKQIAEMERSMMMNNGGSNSSSITPFAASSSQYPTPSSSSSASTAVGMVDTRSISRIAQELEREGALRLLQLPLPAKNVSTKFRALKCVVFPGFEDDELFVQGFVKNYCRDERLRRIHQNTERNQVIRMRSVESEEDEDAGDALVDDLGLREAFGRPASSSSSKMTGGGGFEELLSHPGIPGGRRGVKRRLDETGGTGNEEDTGAAASIANDKAATTTALATIPGTSDQPHEISYRIRRFVSQAKNGLHNHQYRKLGFAYGVMYRCKVFHKFLWNFLHNNNNNNNKSSGQQLRGDVNDIVGDDDAETSMPLGPSGAHYPSPGSAIVNGGVVFSRETVLHSMPVHLYILVFSGGDILSPSEMALVEDAVAHKRLFIDLPEVVRDKIWSHESQRTAKVLGTLADLDLINSHKIGMKSLIKILRAGYTDGRDGVLSRALKDNALGGLFKLEHRAQILLDDKSGDSDYQFYPPGTTEKNYSFANLLPLRFAFNSERDVDRYWEALECLCLEQMVMEVVKPKRNEPAVCEVPKPVKTRARRMLRILAWISRSRKPTTKPAVPAAGGTGTTDENGRVPASKSSKRIEKHSGIVSKSFVPRVKRRLNNSNKDATTRSSNSTADSGLENGSESNAKPHRRQRALSTSQLIHNEDGDGDNEATGGTGGNKKSVPGTMLWTEENERDLLTLFVENCKSRWKITIPQGLQRDFEAVAFRNPTLSRSGFGLVTIARKLGKRRIDVKKRLKEKLMEPAAKLLFERAKREAILLEHPSGVFDEEAMILESSRLTALFRRAVMMVVSPQQEYHPLVAEELISFWTAREIRLVWRYLWLKNWIVRATEKERVRGYTTSQRLQDFLKLTTLSYPLWLFRQAAEHESMIHSTLEEITTSSNNNTSASVARTTTTTLAQQQQRVAHSPDQLFEAEFPVNATPGQCALELAGQVMGTCSLLVTHSPMGKSHGDDETANAAMDPDARASLIISRKRNLRFLNYKNLKGGSGFAAHLAKHVNFQKPSLLIDSWHVETKMHAVTLDDREQLRQLEAFSMEDREDNQGLGTTAFVPFKRRKKSQDDGLEPVVVELVRESGESGISLPELMDKLRKRTCGDNKIATTTTQAHATICEELLQAPTRMEVTVGRWLNTLVDDGALLCVNAYSDQRYVVKDHGDVWLLRPFSLVTMSSKGANPRVVFEGEKDTLSFPWLKMDGSTNYKFLFSIQRKLLAFILTAPGITEQSVYLKMDKLLSLQDTREALSLLVEEGLVYVRGAQVSHATLFSKKRKRSEGRVVNLEGSVLNFDRSKLVVHYFPHLECIQRFGSIVQDYQNELADFHRL